MSAKKPAHVGVKIVKANDPAPIMKSEKSEQVEETAYSSEWLSPSLELTGLKEAVDHSSILPQCIQAYKSNIAGFGIDIRYKDDIEEETEEMGAEYERAEQILALLNLDMDITEVFENVVEGRETYGIAYLEVLRNVKGEVVEVNYIKDIPSIRKSKALDPEVEISVFFKGTETPRRKKFRRYRQDVGGKTVYFKEFGDPRTMRKSDGVYMGENETLPLSEQANELLEFPIGTAPYGNLRWSGQILAVDGSRRAENLNNNYFYNGRHTPLLIMVKGGTLTDESFTKLQEYMNDIKGESGQHAFLILETESSDNTTAFEVEQRAEIEVKDIASVLQKDELFQDYLENNRRRIQSAFRLPDIYTGYTTDFNRATAQTAQEVTEKQVFQPERKRLAWIVNNKLLNGYNFKYCEAYFKEPDINNPDDMCKILAACSAAGGLTPNKAKEVLYTALGDKFEMFEGDWADTPLAVLKAQNSVFGAPIAAQLNSTIEKAAEAHDDEIVAVLKEVRSLLRDREGE